jgi:hypothetical protein
LLAESKISFFHVYIKENYPIILWLSFNFNILCPKTIAIAINIIVHSLQDNQNHFISQIFSSKIWKFL